MIHWQTIQHVHIHHSLVIIYIVPFTNTYNCSKLTAKTRRTVWQQSSATKHTKTQLHKILVSSDLNRALAINTHRILLLIYPMFLCHK